MTEESNPTAQLPLDTWRNSVERMTDTSHDILTVVQILQKSVKYLQDDAKAMEIISRATYHAMAFESPLYTQVSLDPTTHNVHGVYSGPFDLQGNGHGAVKINICLDVGKFKKDNKKLPIPSFINLQ